MFEFNELFLEFTNYNELNEKLRFSVCGPKLSKSTFMTFDFRETVEKTVSTVTVLVCVFVVVLGRDGLFDRLSEKTLKWETLVN